MNKYRLKQLAIAVCSGSVLFQAPGCAETATILTSIFTGLTTGGVFFLLNQIINN
ncbi:MAG: hypothetical protein IH986_14695 [Planctomycetes bacterium]|nr:hypothetical protein [Planctomycetota bacterium]